MMGNNLTTLKDLQNFVFVHHLQNPSFSWFAIDILLYCLLQLLCSIQKCQSVRCTCLIVSNRNLFAFTLVLNNIGIYFDFYFFFIIIIWKTRWTAKCLNLPFQFICTRFDRHTSTMETKRKQDLFAFQTLESDCKLKSIHLTLVFLILRRYLKNNPYLAFWKRKSMP